jgi:hypothetical protein
MSEINSTLTADIAKTLFLYDRETGVLKWKVKPSPRIAAGAIAGSVDSCGYRQIRYKSNFVMAHRLIWLMESGSWPSGEIDHINGDKLDNRIANLREVDRCKNMQNIHTPNPGNKTGYRGVYFHRQSGTYRASASVNNMRYGLGNHKTPEEANAAYIAFKQKQLGY